MAFSWGTSGLNPLETRWNACSPNLSVLFSYLKQRWGAVSLGCHVDRPIVGGSTWSAHAFGAALDPRLPNRTTTLTVLNWLIANHQVLGVLRLNDYAAQRVWDNERLAWKSVNLQEGDWIHIETTFAMYNNSTPIVNRAIQGDGDLTPAQELLLISANTNAVDGNRNAALAATKAEQARVEAAASKVQATSANVQSSAANTRLTQMDAELDTVRASIGSLQTRLLAAEGTLANINSTLITVRDGVNALLNQPPSGGGLTPEQAAQLGNVVEALDNAGAAITSAFDS